MPEPVLLPAAVTSKAGCGGSLDLTPYPGKRAWPWVLLPLPEIFMCGMGEGGSRSLGIHPASPRISSTDRATAGAGMRLYF